MTRALFCLRAFLSAALLFGAGTAAAVDGVVEINHASVTAAGGYPAVISVSGSYRLTGNLTAPSGKNGIDVSANNVQIDLNGFTIEGFSFGPLVHGISASTGFGLSVRNGTIRNFGGGGAGIDAGGSSKIVDVKLVDNTIGVRASDCLIDSSLVVGSGSPGAIVADGCTIQNNVVTGTSDGIAIRGAGNVIIGNRLSGNEGGAIGITGFGGSLIQNNVLVGNGNVGITDGTAGPPPTEPPLSVHQVVIIGNTFGEYPFFGSAIRLSIPALIADNSFTNIDGSAIVCGVACVVRSNSFTRSGDSDTPSVRVGQGSSVTDNAFSFGGPLMLPLTASYSRNTFNDNLWTSGPLDVVAEPPGAHPTSGLQNLCSGVLGPAPTCP
jgi:parallel beta-helix repeat protein